MSAVAAVLLGTGSAPVVEITDASITDISVVPSTALAGYNLLNDGRIQQNEGGSITDVGFWITPQSGMSNYSVRSNGGAWLGLSASRVFTAAQSGIGVNSDSLVLEIRLTSSGVNRTSDLRDRHG
jgi:hypothetical protein